MLKPDKYEEVILDSLIFQVEKKRVKVYGFVIMPNYIHLLWKMEEPHLRAEVQLEFLRYTAQQIKFDLLQHHPAVLEKFRVIAKDRQYQLWERNPLSVYCYSIEATKQKLNYIHSNPIQEKWRLTDLPENYHFSSACFYFESKDNFGVLTQCKD